MRPGQSAAVERIDFQRRMVHLDDGDILRLGAERLPESPGARVAYSHVQGPIPVADPGSAAGQQGRAGE